MEIRRATSRDLPRIMAIERRSFPVPWSETSMLSVLGDDDVIFNVAADEGGAAGFAVLRCSFESGELYNIAVEEEHRGQGVGRSLLLRTLEDAAERDVETVYLEVRRSNAIARSLYTGCGFTVCGQRRNYYDTPREDAILMDCQIRRQPAP